MTSTANSPIEAFIRSTLKLKIDAKALVAIPPNLGTSDSDNNHAGDLVTPSCDEGERNMCVGGKFCWEGKKPVPVSELSLASASCDSLPALSSSLLESCVESSAKNAEKN